MIVKNQIRTIGPELGHHLRLGPALSVLWGPQSVLNLWKHYTLKPQRSFCPNTSHFEHGRSLVFRLSLSCPPKTVVCKLQILFERDHWRLLCPEISQRSSKHGRYEDMCPLPYRTAIFLNFDLGQRAIERRARFRNWPQLPSYSNWDAFGGKTDKVRASQNGRS